jgi:hypothetical protein
MKFHFIVNGTILFESEGGSLTVSKEVLNIAGMGGESFEAVTFRIVDDVAELVFEENKTLNATERAFVQRNEYIQAIKALRGRRGLGLKEAKDEVDTYRRRNRDKPWGLAS